MPSDIMLWWKQTHFCLRLAVCLCFSYYYYIYTYKASLKACRILKFSLCCSFIIKRQYSITTERSIYTHGAQPSHLLLGHIPPDMLLRPSHQEKLPGKHFALQQEAKSCSLCRDILLDPSKEIKRARLRTVRFLIVMQYFLKLMTT